MKNGYWDRILKEFKQKRKNIGSKIMGFSSTQMEFKYKRRNLMCS